jgi:hypothetical protein
MLLRTGPRARSYNVISEPGKVDVECDSFKCGHCQLIVFAPVNKKEQAAFAKYTIPAYHCPMCRSYVCANCAMEMARTLKCVPFEARLAARESKAAFLAMALAQEMHLEILSKRKREEDEIEQREKGRMGGDAAGDARADAQGRRSLLTGTG